MGHVRRHRIDQSQILEQVVNVVAIIQARMGSTRLPGKVLKPIGGVPMIDLLLARLSQAVELDRIVVAMPLGAIDQPLADHVAALGYAVSRGSLDDVLDRYLQAGRTARADVIVRITADCPLIDPTLVDAAVRRFRDARVDYLSNVAPPTYPDGLDVEVFTHAALERAAAQTRKPGDREHVTPYLRDSAQFTRANLSNEEDLSALRWTVDEPADYEVISRVFAHFAPDILFGWRQVLNLQRHDPEIFAVNGGLIRNEGSKMGKGQKLWKRAKQIIPGGNMLLSKRAEMFLPEQWPAYFSRAKGCTVWDLDDHEYIDMSIMGIGTNTLGYGHPEVDAAVRSTIDNGNMSTLNAPEEVHLAERLVELHPWSEMVRFARTGGEADAIAVRIARAASGRDKVAFCGYHGWHDWYLSANLGDATHLAGHLLPGLEPNGVPASLHGTALPFNFNDIAGLEAILRDHDVGVIMMEVSRSTGPENGFLQRVRQLATDHGAVLVFDECTSGFRQSFGGLHKLHGVEPDMAMFGKTLGNGYAITALIGRRAVMEAAQQTFISSTFWTDRIGSAAALKALEVMERVQSWNIITRIGLGIRERWQQLADKHSLQISHWGLPAIAGYTFQSPRALEYKTLVTQEMLDKGYLATTCCYACIEHSPHIVDRYFEALDPVFALIRECEDGRDVRSLLKGPVCHAGFKRLN